MSVGDRHMRSYSGTEMKMPCRGYACVQMYGAYLRNEQYANVYLSQLYRSSNSGHTVTWSQFVCCRLFGIANFVGDENGTLHFDLQLVTLIN